jgi:hypothetical protein
VLAAYRPASPSPASGQDSRPDSTLYARK